MTFPTILLAMTLWQTTPSGGAIAKFVPPVPTPASFISDQRSVLTADQRQLLDGRIRAVQGAGLGDIAVAILPSIGSYAPQQVAVEIYRTWKVGSVAAIGSAHRNVGELILIVPKELAPDNKGQCFILTGTGSEGVITDATAGAICRDSIIPHLRNRDYVGAVAAGIGGLETRLRADAGLTTTPAPAAPRPSRLSGTTTQSDSPAASIVFFIIFGILIAGIALRIYARKRARTCPRCGKRMRRLDEQADDAKLDRAQRLEETIKSIDYDVWVCECGESKVIPYRRWFSKYSECQECHRRTASSTYSVIVPATTVSTGIAQKNFFCQNCKASWTVQIILPRITQSSSSSSSGGGGGGGSSFGGSGSTSGGGGGSSY